MPARLAPARFGFILSGFTSFAVCGIAMLRNTGLVDGIVGLFVNAWLPSWALTFPVVLVVAPITRRLVGRMVKAPGASAQ